MSQSIKLSGRCGRRRASLARFERRLVISGHSAGGHLAACMLATDWPAFDASLPEDLVMAAYAISGLCDLGPLVETSINIALRLDTQPQGPVSPLFWKAPVREASMRWWAKTKARSIFGKAKALSRSGRGRGRDTVRHRCQRNHFTAIAPLADPDSPMVARLRELAGASFQKSVGLPGFGLLRQIALSIKCLGGKALPDSPGYWP